VTVYACPRHHFGLNIPENTTTAINSPSSNSTAEGINHKTVFLYSSSSSSATLRDRNRATICNITATTNVMPAVTDCRVHSPGASKPQKRKKVSEKPNRTVIAVIIPCRYPWGRDRLLSCWSWAGGLGVSYSSITIVHLAFKFYQALIFFAVLEHSFYVIPFYAQSFSVHIIS
jgi:hypothetical protein